MTRWPDPHRNSHKQRVFELPHVYDHAKDVPVGGQDLATSCNRRKRSTSGGITSLSIDLHFAADRVNHGRSVRRAYADLVGFWREG